MNYKRVVFCALFLGLIFSPVFLQAQQRYFMGKRSFDSDIKIGLKAGVNFAKMTYSDNRIADLDQVFKARPIIGATVEIPLTKVFSISPEVLIVGRGTYTQYDNSNGISETYSIKSNHIDLRVPVLINIPINGKNRFYVYVAPDIAFRIGGNISVVTSNVNNQGNKQADVSKSNMALTSFGLIGGGGCRFNIPVTKNFYLVARVELGYNHGLIDTFSDMEKDGSTTPININSYDIQGTRTHRGIEAAVVLSIPLDKGEAFCR
ncbi:MAG: PorT family protein [Bacteroidales bacterium]|jgi:hypothetical protein|nr:PorT family protein [Bacteroidales bacterium]